MKTYFGTAILAFQCSSPDAGHKLATEMAHLIGEHNHAANGTVLRASGYIEIVATRR